MAVTEGGGVFDTIIRMKDEASAVAQRFATSVKESLGDTKKATEEASQKTEALAETAVVGYGKIAAAVATATVAVSAFALKTLKSGIDAADQAGETAKRIGISVESYTQLGLVAELAGVRQETLTTALTAFARNSSKAENGAKALSATFERLGIDLETYSKLSPEEKLFAVADALERMPPGFEKARTAQELFGRGGGVMVNVLEGGAQGLRAMMLEADALGVTISGKTAKDADRFNDALDKVSANLTKIRNESTKSVISGFAPLAEAFQKFVQNSGAVEGAANTLILVLKGLGLAANLVGDIFSITGKVLGVIAASVVAIMRGEFREAAGIAKAFQADLADTVKRSKEIYESLLGINAEREKAQGKFKKSSFGEDDGFGFVRTDLRDRSGVYTYSDVAPGAELRTGAREEADQAELDQIDAHHAEVEEKQRAHTIRLTEYDRSARAIRFQVGVQYDKLSLDSASFFFGQMGALMQTKSRALFEVGKAGAIAETIIQTYRAAQGAYAALASIPFVGPALGAAAAAAAIAVGFARVQAIRSTSFGGASGSPILSSGGASGPVVAAGTGVAIPPPESLQGVGAERQREVNIYLSGEGSPTQNYVRDVLVPALNDALGEGARLNVRTA